MNKGEYIALNFLGCIIFCIGIYLFFVVAFNQDIIDQDGVLMAIIPFLIGLLIITTLQITKGWKN